MTQSTSHRELRTLAQEVLSPGQVSSLQKVVRSEFLDYERLTALDECLAGPGIITIHVQGIGRYHIRDRDVFRPIQYCAVWLAMVADSVEADWLTRSIVHMSGAHLEALVKRIGRLGPLPLGSGLWASTVTRRIDPTTQNRLRRFAAIYNCAKHDLSHIKDTHLFSPGDAAVSYIVARALAGPLYPLARLATTWPA